MADMKSDVLGLMGIRMQQTMDVLYSQMLTEVLGSNAIMGRVNCELEKIYSHLSKTKSPDSEQS